MQQPLMPKATAVWLIDNTALTFEQIADFCQIHVLEVQAIADGEVNIGMQGFDPLANGQLSRAEIERCHKDTTARLQMQKSDQPGSATTRRAPKYVPISKRGDKPDAIAWLLKHHPELAESQIASLSARQRTRSRKCAIAPIGIRRTSRRAIQCFSACGEQRDFEAAVTTAGGETAAAESQVASISELP